MAGLLWVSCHRLSLNGTSGRSHQSTLWLNSGQCWPAVRLPGLQPHSPWQSASATSSLTASSAWSYLFSFLWWILRPDSPRKQSEKAEISSAVTCYCVSASETAAQLGPDPCWLTFGEHFTQAGFRTGLPSLSHSVLFHFGFSGFLLCWAWSSTIMPAISLNTLLQALPCPTSITP